MEIRETVIGFVPRIAVSPPYGIGTRSYAALVTDAHTILVPWKGSHTVPQSLLDGDVIEPRDFSQKDPVPSPASWIQDREALVIPHAVTTRLHCHRVVNTYFFFIEFKTNEARRKVSGFLLPSRAFLKRRKAEGFRASHSVLSYAVAVGKVFQKAPALAGVLDWRVS